MPTRNRVLGALPEMELAAVKPHLRPVALQAGEILYRPNEAVTRVYFPINAVLSLLALMQDGTTVEIGTLGREGLSGAPLLLGGKSSPSQLICQIAGQAFFIDVDAFLKQIRTAATLRRLAEAYALALFNFMAQCAACNRLHTVTERCARWLLLTHDRVDGDSFFLTQEFLAAMLGVHRPSVSVAAGTLQQAGFIRYKRGRVEIRDREGLESASCECYWVSARAFADVLTCGYSQLPDAKNRGASQ
jgi:CRP-like cAMP-binding protein